MHELTLAIDESGLATPQDAKLRGAARSDADGGGGDAFVSASKGEPARYAEDARHHR